MTLWFKWLNLSYFRTKEVLLIIATVILVIACIIFSHKSSCSHHSHWRQCDFSGCIYQIFVQNQSEVATGRRHSICTVPKLCTDLDLTQIWLSCLFWECVVVCCSVLQCVAVCCCVLQCVAVCCSVLQCVAVCCSVLQCVAVCCTLSYTLYLHSFTFWYQEHIANSCEVAWVCQIQYIWESVEMYNTLQHTATYCDIKNI